MLNVTSTQKVQVKSVCREVKVFVSTELLACTERQLVRAYPAGKRIDSSNYNPISMWNNGIHMTALNIQTPGMHAAHLCTLYKTSL